MTVQELTEKRATLWNEATKFLDDHTDVDGKISAEDAAAYDKMEADIDALGKQIDRLKRRETMDNYLAQPASAPLLNYPQITGNGKVGRASDEYKKAMLKALRTNFRQVNNLLEEATATQGGFLVPAEWDNRLIETLEEENIMRNLGTRITTEGEHKINIVASKPAASWVSEGQPITFSNASFGQKTLDAYKLGVGIQITNELLYDNVFNLESYIIEQFGKAIANAEEDAFINGTGTNQPTGFLTTLAADATTYITTKGAEPTADEIVDLIYKLPRPYRKNAAFLVNDSTLGLLRKFKDQNQRYLWEESYQAGEPSTFMGYSIYTSPYMPKAESGAFAIAFGDFSYYNIADRGTRTIKELRELYATQDISAFLMLERLDGLLVDNSAIRALKIK